MNDIIIQLVTAFVGSLGFALLFNLRFSLLIPASVGGFFSWGLYLVCINFKLDIFLSSFIASAFAALYSEILARILKAPATLFYIPSVVSLIPGRSLFYTMSFGVRQEWGDMCENAMLTGKYALAIAFGMSFVWSLLYMVKRTAQYCKRG